jgi:hypothetical protein
MTLSQRQRDRAVAFIVLGFFIVMYLWSWQIDDAAGQRRGHHPRHARRDRTH